MFMMSILTYMYVFQIFPPPHPLKNFWIHTCHAYLSIIGNKIDQGTPADISCNSSLWKGWQIHGENVKTVLSVRHGSKNIILQNFLLSIPYKWYTCCLHFSGSYCPFFSHWIWLERLSFFFFYISEPNLIHIFYMG